MSATFNMMCKDDEKIKSQQRELVILKLEQTLLRSHIQKWCEVFLDLANEEIDKDEALEEMIELYLSDAYEEPDDKTGEDS